MQEEVENRAVTLVISATKLTARLLKAVIWGRGEPYAENTELKLRIQEDTSP